MLSSDLVYKASFTKRITVSQTSVGYIGEALVSSMTGYDYSKWSKRAIVSVYATYINDTRYSATWSLRNSGNMLNIETFFAGDFDVIVDFLYTK